MSLTANRWISDADLSSLPQTTTAPVAAAIFPGITDDVVVFVGPDTNRDVLVRYIVEQGTINPSADANWKFRPVPEQPFCLKPARVAPSMPHQWKVSQIEPAGDGDDGFALYRIKL